MKIAVLTDIHGNCYALEAVLQDIDALGDVKQIYSLGDHIGVGHQTNEVMELLLSREDIIMIRGNYEDRIIEIIDQQPSPVQSNKHEHYRWVAENLEKRYIQTIRNLPRSLSLDMGKFRCFFVHYHLNANKESYQYIDRDPTGNKLDKLYQDASFDLICFGHHHTHYSFETTHRMYVNPGSLGCNHDMLARYAIFEFDKEIRMISRAVAYDKDRFIKEYCTIDIPHSEVFLKKKYGGCRRVH